MTTDARKQIGASIAEFFQKRYCVLAGNGTSALTIAIELTAPAKKHVLLPAMACYNTVMAVYFARKIPVFADILESDATLDPQKVEQAVHIDPNIGAVLIVHLFGHPAQTEEIIRICRSKNIMAIEDQAQAVGGRYPTGEPLGALGDISIASFGHTKILDVGGGGVLLTDNIELYMRAISKAENLPHPSDKADTLEQIYRQLYYTIWRAGIADARFLKLFDEFPMKFEDLFIFRPSDNLQTRINKSLETLERTLSERRKIENIYLSKLDGVEGIRFFSPREGAVPWRFTFRMEPNIRDEVFDRVRQNGFDISAWYPCCTEWTPSGRNQGIQMFPVASMLEKEVVNLWVAENYTHEKALSLAKSIKEEIASAKRLT